MKILITLFCFQPEYLAKIGNAAGSLRKEIQTSSLALSMSYSSCATWLTQTQRAAIQSTAVTPRTGMPVHHLGS